MPSERERGRKQDDRYRLVVPKHAQTKEVLSNAHSKHNRNNAIKTTKYSVWSFLPKNLFEQFHRFANIYFLGIVILNLIPEINAFGKYIAMVPLIFVLSVTAIKDLFEDRRRYKSDKAVNNSICHVFNSEAQEYQPVAWKKVVVGDFVKLRSDESIPADILLLNTSDTNSVCHIETANLDGETNLKQREVVKGLNMENSRFFPGLFPYKLKCELPNNHIHRFHGTLINDEGKEIAVGKNNLLLRGCIIRNTDWVEGMVVYAGHDSKALMNNSGPRYKRSKVERDLNVDVVACVVILFILCFLGGVGCGFWTDRNDFFNRHFTPGSNSSDEPFVRGPLTEGFIRFWTFIIILQGFASKYYRLHNSKLAEWSSVSGRRHTGCCENYPISGHHFSTLFVISLPLGGFCKASELVCKDCWPNLSEMELRTFLRIQKLVWVQLLTCNAEIIQK